MLYGKILRSTEVHAKILNINTSQASKVIGVKSVITGKDIPILFGTPPLGLIDQPLFAIERVRYAGEPVAGVVAVDRDTAEEALGLVKVEYEQLPPVYDAKEAMEPGAPLLHENLVQYEPGRAKPVKGTNICDLVKLRKGDIERGFSESDFIFEDTFTSPMNAHCCMETHSAIVAIGAEGNVTVWTGSGVSWRIRSAFCKSFNIPELKVRFIILQQGGNFGSKNGLTIEPRAYALSLKTGGRPVKLTYSREEEFTSTVVKHPVKLTLKTGVKKDGTLWARKAKLIWNTGAYSERGAEVVFRGTISSPGPYRIPHVHADGYCVYTNTPISSAFRGFGVPQITWACESQMDIIAEELGIDPVEIRLKNAFETDDVSPTGVKLKAVGLKECIHKVAAEIGWYQRGKDKEKTRGIGIACVHKTQNTSASAALLRLEKDGTIILSISSPDVGQGSHTIFTQIIAEELGVSMETIKVVTPVDTDTQLESAGASGSGMTFMAGYAVANAARELKQQLLDLTSELLGLDKERLLVKNGAVFAKDNRERRLSLKDLAASSPQGQIVGKGVHTYDSGTINRETGQGFAPVWMYGAQAAEVEVDRETGLIKVLRIVAAQDVGRVINPKQCEGQIEGSVAMGLGPALWEEVLLKDGKVLNPNFHDYKIVTHSTMPKIVPILVEKSHDQGAYGAKGVGEPAVAPTAAAIANAVYDAVGIRIKDCPLTPERVLQALQKR